MEKFKTIYDRKKLLNFNVRILNKKNLHLRS